MATPAVPIGSPGPAELAPFGTRASSSYLYPLIATVVLFAIWELATRFGNISPLILPAPSKILTTAIDHFPVLLRMSAVTAYEFVLGFLLAAAIGLPLGALIVYSRPIEMTFYPMLVAFQTIPKAAIAPILIVWLGTGIMSKVLIAFAISFFPSWSIRSSDCGRRNRRPSILCAPWAGRRIRCFGMSGSPTPCRPFSAA